jgi:hypothetical protein
MEPPGLLQYSRLSLPCSTSLLPATVIKAFSPAEQEYIPSFAEAIG